MSKRRRDEDKLLTLQCPGIPSNAVNSILQKIRSSPDIVETCGADVSQQLNRRSLLQFAKFSRTLKLQQLDNQTFDWQICDLQKLIPAFVQRSTSYGNAVSAALDTTSDQCLNAVVYHDEISSGTPLRPCNRRKFMLIYLSFMEFRHLLRDEHHWLIVGSLRHEVITNIQGGLSNVMQVLFRHIFLGDHGLHSRGIVLHVNGVAKLMFCKFGLLLADEAALKSTFDFKGAAGIRPCVFCSNVISKSSNLKEHDATKQLVTICEPSLAKCVRQSSQDVWRSHDKLQQLHESGSCTKSNLDKFEKACGLTYNQWGVLSCRELRNEVLPVEMSCYESMHTYFSQGTAAHELHLFLSQCKKILNVTFDSVARFCSASWLQPASRGPVAVANMFSSAREAATHDHFKGTAGEVLSAFSLIRQFAEDVVAPLSQNEPLMLNSLRSFRSMSNVITLLVRLKNKSQITNDDTNQLRQLQEVHMLAFLASYGESEIKPKHHFCLHIPDQLDKFGFLYDVWTLERKHIVAKRIGDTIMNLTSYEKSVTARLLNAHFQNAPLTFADRLLGKVESTDMLSSTFGAAMFSKSMNIGGFTVSANDIIFSQGLAFKVCGCVQNAAANLAFLVHCYTHIGARGHGQLWKLTDTTVRVLEPTDFIPAEYWTYLRDDSLLTLNI